MEDTRRTKTSESTKQGTSEFTETKAANIGPTRVCYYYAVILVFYGLLSMRTNGFWTPLLAVGIFYSYCWVPKSNINMNVLLHFIFTLFCLKVCTFVMSDSKGVDIMEGKDLGHKKL